MCGPLGKTVSANLNTSLLPVVLHVGFKPAGLSFFHFGTQTAIVLSHLMFRQSCWGDFINIKNAAGSQDSMICTP